MEDADHANADPAAREGRLCDEHEGIQRVAVFPTRALDDP